jgi:protein phosphatase
VRWIAILGVLVLLAAIIGFAGYKWSQNQYYVASNGDDVAIFRGVEADVPVITTHHVEETSDLTLDDLPDYNARQVRDGISASSLEDARGIVSRLERLVLCPEPTKPSPSTSPSRKPGDKTGATATPGKKRTADRPSATPSPSASPSPSTGPTTCTEAP